MPIERVHKRVLKTIRRLEKRTGEALVVHPDVTEQVALQLRASRRDEVIVGITLRVGSSIPSCHLQPPLENCLPAPHHAAMTKKTTKAPAKKAAPAAKTKAPKSEAADSGKIAKAQLVEMVADKTGLTKKQSEEAVSTMLECVVTALQDGKSVGLPGLGTLSVKETAARTGVKPGTSEKIQIPAGKKVAFKVASTLKGNL